MIPLPDADETFLRTVFLEQLMTALIGRECQETDDPVATAERMGESMREEIARFHFLEGEAGETVRLHLEDISNSFFDNLAEEFRTGRT